MTGPRRTPGATRRGDLLVAVAVGAALLAFVVYAVRYFSREGRAAGIAEGIIVRKDFVPRPETQITLGPGGLDRRQLAGEHSFQVRVPRDGDREYKVPVDARLYETHRVGDHLFFKVNTPGAR